MRYDDVFSLKLRDSRLIWKIVDGRNNRRFQGDGWVDGVLGGKNDKGLMEALYIV